MRLHPGLHRGLGQRIMPGCSILMWLSWRMVASLNDGKLVADGQIEALGREVRGSIHKP